VGGEAAPLADAVGDPADLEELVQRLPGDLPEPEGVPQADLGPAEGGEVAAEGAAVEDGPGRPGGGGGLDTLVNNAGVGVFSEVASMSDADWSRVIDTNLTGPFYCSRAAIPALRQAGGGWILSIASLAGRNYFPGGAAYCASKAALIAFSEVLMQEVRFDNIRVSVVMPGSVATGFSGRAVRAEDAWKLTGDDVAQVVMDLLHHPGRSLPSRVELRPSKPNKG
jgi:NAD(P)-dependent dehydrogenase (short-subunit alcohol dehydrogenase family)